MQDVHEILGAGVVTGDVGNGARIFGDRRLRAPPNGSLHHQSLKCPRCDSLNTKFCYYNNYNLSQPRHFCKNCRRYWTKGGVLRNVPVGGGCRKSKRSSRRKTSGSPHRSSKRRHKSDSRSSSESTAVGSGKAIGVATKASEVGTEFTSNPNFEFSEQPPATVAVTFNSIAMEQIPSCSGMNSNFEPLSDLQASAGVNSVDPDGSAMFTDIGGFVSLMDRDQHQNLLEFGNIETTPFGIHQNQVNNQLLLQNFGADRDWQKEKIDGVGDEWGQEIFDQTVNVDLLRNSRTGDGVLAGPDWHGVSGGGEAGAGGHLGMFDLTPGSDWSQSSQWHESDLHLYLPP